LPAAQPVAREHTDGAAAAHAEAPAAHGAADEQLDAQLLQLSELNRADTMCIDGVELSKKEALLELIARYSGCSRTYSLLARDLLPGETALIPSLAECEVGALELCLAALQLDDADVAALRVLVCLNSETGAAVQMPHDCGAATPEQLCREIYFIKKGAQEHRRFSKAAGAARVAELAAARAAAQAAAARAAVAADAAAAAEVARAATRLAKAERAPQAAAPDRAFTPEDAVTLLHRALRLGGVAEADICPYISALVSGSAPGVSPLAAAVDSAVLAALLRAQKNAMSAAAALLQAALRGEGESTAVICAPACEAQTMFQQMFPPSVDDDTASAPGDDAGASAKPRRTLRLGVVPTACRPFVALAHLLADAKGTWADDAATHLVSYTDPPAHHADQPQQHVQPSPMALLALALLAHRTNNLVAASMLLFAFAHWGADVQGVRPDGAFAVGAYAAGWLSADMVAAATAAADRMSGRSAGMRSGSLRMGLSSSSDGDAGQQDTQDGSEAEWAQQKLQQSKLPQSQQLLCPALDKIMTEFDGLRAVKDACLQLFNEVKQARARAACTGMQLREELSDSPHHFIFLGNVRLVCCIFHYACI
jgi:hypothetical protein